MEGWGLGMRLEFTKQLHTLLNTMSCTYNIISHYNIIIIDIAVHVYTYTCLHTLQIILSHKSEILSVDCEMSAVHGLLSKLPDTLSYEQLITVAAALFEKHSPNSVAKKGRLKMRHRSVSLLLFPIFLSFLFPSPSLVFPSLFE